MYQIRVEIKQHAPTCVTDDDVLEQVCVRHGLTAGMCLAKGNKFREARSEYKLSPMYARSLAILKTGSVV